MRFFVSASLICVAGCAFALIIPACGSGDDVAPECRKYCEATAKCETNQEAALEWCLSECRSKELFQRMENQCHQKYFVEGTQSCAELKALFATCFQCNAPSSKDHWVATKCVGDYNGAYGCTCEKDGQTKTCEGVGNGVAKCDDSKCCADFNL